MICLVWGLLVAPSLASGSAKNQLRPYAARLAQARHDADKYAAELLQGRHSAPKLAASKPAAPVVGPVAPAALASVERVTPAARVSAGVAAPKHSAKKIETVAAVANGQDGKAGRVVNAAPVSVGVATRKRSPENKAAVSETTDDDDDDEAEPATPATPVSVAATVQRSPKKIKTVFADIDEPEGETQKPVIKTPQDSNIAVKHLKGDLDEVKQLHANVAQLEKTLAADVSLLRESAALQHVSKSQRGRQAAKQQVREVEKLVESTETMVKASRLDAEEGARQAVQEAREARRAADALSAEAAAQLKFLDPRGTVAALQIGKTHDKSITTPTSSDDSTEAAESDDDSNEDLQEEDASM